MSDVLRVVTDRGLVDEDDLEEMTSDDVEDLYTQHVAPVVDALPGAVKDLHRNRVPAPTRQGASQRGWQRARPRGASRNRGPLPRRCFAPWRCPSSGERLPTALCAPWRPTTWTLCTTPTSGRWSTTSSTTSRTTSDTSRSPHRTRYEHLPAPSARWRPTGGQFAGVDRPESDAELSGSRPLVPYAVTTASGQRIWQAPTRARRRPCQRARYSWKS